MEPGILLIYICHLCLLSQLWWLWCQSQRIPSTDSAPCISVSAGYTETSSTCSPIAAHTLVMAKAGSSHSAPPQRLSMPTRDRAFPLDILYYSTGNTATSCSPPPVTDICNYLHGSLSALWFHNLLNITSPQCSRGAHDSLGSWTSPMSPTLSAAPQYS